MHHKTRSMEYNGYTIGHSLEFAIFCLFNFFCRFFILLYSFNSAIIVQMTHFFSQLCRNFEYRTIRIIQKLFQTCWFFFFYYSAFNETQTLYSLSHKQTKWMKSNTILLNSLNFSNIWVLYDFPSLSTKFLHAKVYFKWISSKISSVSKSKRVYTVRCLSTADCD